jgi:hypothetical protein
MIEREIEKAEKVMVNKLDEIKVIEVDRVATRRRRREN